MNAPLQTYNGVNVFGGAGRGAPSGAVNPYATFAPHLHLDSREDFHRQADHLVGWRRDAGLTAAFARQLEHVFQKVYEAEFYEYRARDFFPVNSEVEAGALSFTYRMSNRVGNAAVINAGNARDLPNVDVDAEEWQAPVVTFGASYNFSVINQMSATMANFPIEALKAKATREAIEALEESTFCSGLSAMGVAGVVNCPGIAATTKISTGTWISQVISGIGTAPLSATLVNALAADVLAMKAQVFNQSAGRHQVTDILLPHNLWSALNIVPQSSLFTDKTLLEWLQKLTGVNFDYWPALITAGAVAGSPLQVAAVSGANPQQYTRIFAYEKNPEVMQLVVAQPFTQLAPQPTGMVWEVPCFSRIGGALSIRPLGCTYMDGC